MCIGFYLYFDGAFLLQLYLEHYALFTEMFGDR